MGSHATFAGVNIMELVQFSLPLFVLASLVVGCAVSAPVGDLTIQYHENGQKKSEGLIFKGEKNGLWTEWHENGQKSMECRYKNGEMDGPVAMWYKNGQQRMEGEYKNEKTAGQWNFWREDGSLVPFEEESLRIPSKHP